MTPKVTWRRVLPADVLSALKTLGPLRSAGRIIRYRGQDVETLLGWAFTELDLAEKATSVDEKARHASQVVVHAKKALDCLFDAYLERDFLDIRLRPRAGFSEKLELLKNRLGGRLPWRLVPAAVAEPRDDSEHSRVPPPPERAGVAAEAAKMTIEAMVAASNPLHGPAHAGSFGWGMRSTDSGYYQYVTGFPEQFAWLWRCSDGIPRIGIGVSTSDATDTAEVCYCDLEQFALAEHLEALQLWEQFEPWSWMSERAVREMMQLAGLDQPS
jgi:hypothetical protein